MDPLNSIVIQEVFKIRIIEGNDQDLFNAVSTYASTLISNNQPRSIINVNICDDRDEDEDDSENEDEKDGNKDKQNNLNLNHRLVQDIDYSFKYKDDLFILRIIKKADKPIKVSHHVYTLLQNIVIKTCADDSLINDFVKEANKYYRNNILNIKPKTKQKIHIKVWDDDYWSILDTVHKRLINTLYLTHLMKKEILDTVNNFIMKKTKDIYKYLGVSYKLNILFEGPPGCGKTTTIKTIASYIDYDINVLTFDVHTTDTKFMRAIKDIRAKTILVLEDIDCLFVERKTNDTNKNMITFSSLLNVLDGLTSKEGLIVIMTSNFKNNLDEALIRPGRIDTIIHFDYITKEQLQQIYMKFIFCSENMESSNTTPDETRQTFFETFYTEFKKLRLDVPCSLIQQYLFKYVDQPQLSITNINDIKKIHQDTKKEKANMYM